MKVYKITLYVSLIVFAILTILSIALNFWNDNKWIAFIVNWCVGIACSIVVVIITTLIQFKVEQKKAINKLVLIVRALIFHNEFFGSIFVSGVMRNADTVTDLDKIENNWRNSLKEDMEKVNAVLMELEFFFKNPVLLKMLKLSNAFNISQFDKSEKNYEVEAKLLETEYEKVTRIIVDFAETLVSLKVKSYGKEEIEKYILDYRSKL
ncbi:MAG: hypothetical protein ACI4DY_06840 [Monoglobaceae bacterium]